MRDNTPAIATSATPKAQWFAEGNLVKEPMKPAMRVQIELALASRRNDLTSLKVLEIEGRRIALTGAEVDAAKRGGSFDAVIDIAVKFALAVQADDEDAIARTRRKLTVFGLAAIACDIFDIVRRSELPSSR
ncbi:hypothetical protein DTW90_32105 [Neorhizobium sp. P12A]|nr:hypothetical protein DTW90_32105 [Neorhizobium sp. P12A]